jgi:hypothetical protein
MHGNEKSKPIFNFWINIKQNHFYKFEVLPVQPAESSVSYPKQIG